VCDCICSLRTISKSFKAEKIPQKIKTRQEKYYKAVDNCKEKMKKLTKSRTDPNKVYIISKQQQYEEETKQLMSKVQDKKEMLKHLQDQDQSCRTDFISEFETMCHDSIAPFELLVSSLILNVYKILKQTKKVSAQMIGNAMGGHIQQFK
jgi:hypothetical protein